MERKGKRSYSAMSNASTVVLPARFGRSVRTYKRRKLMKRTRNVVPFGARFPPARVVTKQRYSLLVGSNDTAIDDNIIRLNSVFDPELTQTGHQPMGRDQMVTLYNKYLVTRVDCEWIVQITGSTSSAFLITLVPSNDGTVITSLAAAREQAGSRCWPVNIAAPAKFRTSYKPNQITGVSMAKYRSDDLYSSIISTSPSEEIVLHILLSDGAGAGTVSDGVITLSAVFTFTIEWFDPVQLGLS